MKILGIAVALVAVMSNGVNGFISSSTPDHRSFSNTLTRRELADSAQALSDYMAKSHEDKLRAIQDVETKKNAEIEALRKEIESLKSGSTAGSSAITAAPSNLAEGSKEELLAKLISYQSFMAKYIVEAQEQKLQAVRAAEAAVAAKYEQKLQQLALGGAAPAAAAPPAVVVAGSTPVETKLYKERSAKVSAAAAAGKSRWGQGEIARVTSGDQVVNVGAAAIVQKAKPAVPETNVVVVNGAINGAAVNGAAAAATTTVAPSVPVPVPPEVEAADHGLRADGGVGGLTLAERVAMGAAAAASAVNDAALSFTKESSLYQARNRRVAAMGNQSRWGKMELERATKLASEAPLPVAKVVSPEVQAADHGMRADGGVGGPTLAERVNLGAQLLGR